MPPSPGSSRFARPRASFLSPVMCWPRARPVRPTPNSRSVRCIGFARCSRPKCRTPRTDEPAAGTVGGEQQDEEGGNALTKPFPIRIAFRNVKRSEALETAIRYWVERLAPLGPEIVACDVVIKVLRRGRGRPKLFRVRVALAVPGDDIVAHHAVQDEDMARHPYAAVRDAFVAAERQLLDRTGRPIGRAHV